MTSKRSRRLSPCPFCGGEADIYTSYENPDVFNIKCTNCFARTGWYHNEDSAIRAWNMRPDGD